MCPSSPSAWQIWSWADPFPSLSKKLFYFVKKGCCKQPQKEIGVPERGRLSLFFATYSLRCQPVIDRLSPLRPLRRSASGAAGVLCAKIIEACSTQDCQLSQRPEEVLNIMRNAPAKPLCKGPRAVFLPLHCLPRRSNALCHKVHFRQWQVLCHSAMPAISEQKTARQKQGASRRTHPASLFISHNVR